MSDLSQAALSVYAENASRLIDAYETVDADQLFAPFLDILPPAGATVLDVGAGTGRDAAWLATRGHAVTAVEPTEGLRAAGLARHGAAIAWLPDTLPDLRTLGQRSFDFVLVNAVWHHLGEAERDRAILRLYALVRPGGHALISLRQGPDRAGQPVALLDTYGEGDRAKRAGFRILDLRGTLSRQDHNRAAGITWDWLVLQKGAAE